MEPKKSPPPAAAELCGRKSAAAGGASPAAGYFSSVFPPPPAANGKDSTQTDLYAMLNKQNSKMQSGSAYGGIAGNGKSHGSPTKSRAAYSKDGKPLYPFESSESPYFGSSVHYGGRDFYGSSPQKHGTESSRNYEEDNQDGSAATRGDWWQGSLYY